MSATLPNRQIYVFWLAEAYGTEPNSSDAELVANWTWSNGGQEGEPMRIRVSMLVSILYINRD